MPCLNCGTPHGNHGHQWCNGGIPQLANTTAHVAAMERDMASRVPENFTGFIVHVSFSRTQADLDCCTLSSCSDGFSVGSRRGQDWEAWVVPWELSGNGHADNSGGRFKAYQNASVALARSLHPDKSEAELEEIAAAAYTKAGIDLLVLTVQTTKRLRPHIAGVGKPQAPAQLLCVRLRRVAEGHAGHAT